MFCSCFFSRVKFHSKLYFFFSSRRRHTRSKRDWSSDVCSSDLRRPEAYIEVATRDAIRHWAHGIGYRNPYWASAGTAPPTILFAMDRVASGYVGGLPGIHAMYAGTDFRWHRAIREDDRIVGESVLKDVIEKPSAFAKR